MDKNRGTNLQCLAIFHTRQTNSRARIQLCLSSPSTLPTPPTMLNTSTSDFSCISTLYWVGKGGQQHIFKRTAKLFYKIQSWNTDNSLHYTSVQGLLSTIVIYTRDFLNVVLALFQWSNPGFQYFKLFWHLKPSNTLTTGLFVTLRSVVKFSNEQCSQQVIIQKWPSRPCSVLNEKKVSRAWEDWLTFPANIEFYYYFFKFYLTVCSQKPTGTDRKSHIYWSN